MVIDVNERDEKKFLAIKDRVRESTQNWPELLLDLKRRGMNETKVVVGDGSLGLWATLDEIDPCTRPSVVGHT